MTAFQAFDSFAHRAAMLVAPVAGTALVGLLVVGAFFI